MKLLLVSWLTPAAVQAGVKMIEGRGKIVDPHTVSVQGKKYTVCPYYLLCCVASVLFLALWVGSAVPYVHV